MIRGIRMLALALCIAGLAAPAAAQDALSRRVSLDLKGMAPADAFKVLADSIGMKVTVDPAVTAPVDILVRNVTAKTALTTICESIGCRWKAAGGTIAVGPVDDPSIPARVAVLTKGEPAPSKEQARAAVERLSAAIKKPLPPGLKFDNAPLADVSASLSDALGLSITLASEDPRFKTVTVDFSNQTLVSALQSLAAASGNPPLWRVTISEKAAPGERHKPAIMFAVKGRAVKK